MMIAFENILGLKLLFLVRLLHRPCDVSFPIYKNNNGPFIPCLEEERKITHVTVFSFVLEGL